jgi:cysteine protease ATG4
MLPFHLITILKLCFGTTNRTLVSQFPECGLAVSVATDSTLYQSQVFAASHGDTNYRTPRGHYTRSWGERPVLLLLGIRLGIECVNPIYYETIKVFLSFTNTS